MSNAHAVEHAVEIEAREAPAEASERASALVEFVQRRPWIAVLGAAFAGYALARIVRGMR